MDVKNWTFLDLSNMILELVLIYLNNYFLLEFIWNYPETDVSRQFLLTKVKWQTMDALPCFWGQKDVFLSNVIILLTKEHNKVISFIFWSNKTSGPAVFVRSRCLSRWCSSHHCPDMFCWSTWERSNVQCTYFQSSLTCSMNDH